MTGCVRAIGIRALAIASLASILSACETEGTRGPTTAPSPQRESNYEDFEPPVTCRSPGRSKDVGFTVLGKAAEVEVLYSLDATGKETSRTVSLPWGFNQVDVECPVRLKVTGPGNSLILCGVGLTNGALGMEGARAVDGTCELRVSKDGSIRVVKGHPAFPARLCRVLFACPH